MFAVFIIKYERLILPKRLRCIIQVNSLKYLPVLLDYSSRKTSPMNPATSPFNVDANPKKMAQDGISKSLLLTPNNNRNNVITEVMLWIFFRFCFIYYHRKAKAEAKEKKVITS
jgi:hypothetical protein